MVVPLKTQYGERVPVTEGDHLDLELRPASASIACFRLFISGERREEVHLQEYEGTACAAS